MGWYVPGVGRRKQKGIGMPGRLRIVRRLLHWSAGIACSLAGLLAPGALIHAAVGMRVVRTIRLDQNPVALAVDAQRGHVYVALSDPRLAHAPTISPQIGTVLTYESGTGRLLRTVSVPGGAWAFALAERPGRLFVAGFGSLTMLNAANGAVLKTTTVGQQVDTSVAGNSASVNPALPVDERGNRLFLLSGESVHMYDTTTGTALATIDLGYSPETAAYDPGTGHLLVAGRKQEVPDAGGGSRDAIGTPTVACDNASSCPDMVSVLDGRSGGVLATTTLSGQVLNGQPLPLDPCAFAVDASLHRAVLIRTDGRGSGGALLVDTRTGEVLTVPNLGVNAGCAARVDAVNHRAFVLTAADYGGSSVARGVALVDLSTGAVVKDVRVLLTPRTLAAAGTYAFVGGLTPAGGGSVLAVNGRSGKVMADVPISAAPPPSQNTGIQPSALAVDNMTGRLFVAMPGGQGAEPRLLVTAFSVG